MLLSCTLKSMFSNVHCDCFLVFVDIRKFCVPQFILERTRMVLSILRLKFNVLLADVDAVWLSNPFDHMRSTEFDIFAQVK